MTSDYFYYIGIFLYAGTKVQVVRRFLWLGSLTVQLHNTLSKASSGLIFLSILQFLHARYGTIWYNKRNVYEVFGMRLGWAKKGNSISYYVHKTIRVDGKNKSLVIKRFGSEKYICDN